jgi:membrane protease subunit (stomatin/prohibitin family)
MAGATLVGAQADAMKAAASNSGGAMTGFMGMGMAMNAGGMNAQNFYAMGQQNQQNQQNQNVPASKNESVSGWKCSCGAVNDGKFCAECGSPKPQENGWKCACGNINKGKFCSECGSKKPVSEPLYRCDKCGWEPEDPKNPPKFCPECGDRFDSDDIK